MPWCIGRESAWLFPAVLVGVGFGWTFLAAVMHGILRYDTWRLGWNFSATNHDRNSYFFFSTTRAAGMPPSRRGPRPIVTPILTIAWTAPATSVTGKKTDITTSQKRRSHSAQ